MATADKSKSEKRKGPEKVRRVLEQPKTIEEWIEAKKQNPDKFGYTAEGDLILSPVRQGDVEKVLVIPKYVPASTRQIQEFFKNKAQSTTEPQEQFAMAKQTLRRIVEAYKNGQATALDVKAANQHTKDAEALLNSKYRYPMYYTMITGMPEYDLTFTEYTRTAGGKFTDPVFQASSTPFPLEAFWVPASKAVLEETEETEDMEEPIQQGGQQAQPHEKKKLSYGAIAIINKRRAMKRF